MVPIRPEIIRRAVLASQSRRIQPQGRDPRAGKRTTAVSKGVGLGIARLPRVKGHGYPRAGMGALVHSTVGGRLAHPPKVEKVIVKRINKKERRLALLSALAGAFRREFVEMRGHRVQGLKALPLVVEDRLEEISTTGELRKTLGALGLEAEMRRVEEGRKVRAGKGKGRGRRYRHPKGPLIIYREDRGITKAASNIPGVDALPVRGLKVEALAPGALPGRLTLWSESALNHLRETLGGEHRNEVGSTGPE